MSVWVCVECVFGQCVNAYACVLLLQSECVCMQSQLTFLLLARALHVVACLTVLVLVL